MRRAIAIGALGLSAFLLALPAAAVEKIVLPEEKWRFDGPLGTFDRAELQRGFLVYKEVCAGCHSLKYLAYRNLAEIGFSAAEVKAIAAQVQVTDGPNEQGEMFQRPGLPADRFKSPFANEKAARAANNGAYPPDLSLITKARVGGPDYTYAVLIGYDDPPAGVLLADGMSYNRYFPGHQIAMPQPLASDGQVDYADGTEASVARMARDVTAFLHWAAEPKLEERKRLGLKVGLFLLVLTGLFYLVKRKVWAAAH